jgi:glycosyltransferase involved in cell wall biosynthesis
MKIAFVVPSGLWIGGVEKYTQQIAIELAKDGHDVDYFYTESMLYVPANVVHPGLDLSRKELIESYGVKTIQVTCETAESSEVGGTWNNTNLFSVFSHLNYDVVIGSHKGESTWPFSKIAGQGVKIIETVHGTEFTSGASKYADAYILINEFQRERWYMSGGIPSKTHVIFPMVSVDKSKSNNVRREWNIPDNKFVFGMHQAARKGLFSNIPLDAYREVQDDSNFFVILGGTEEYDNHARRIGLTNFLRIPAVSDSASINSFLSCLDVYSHGRLDGEVCSSAIIEAMSHGLPIVTHPSNFNNGHIFQIDGCGFLARTSREYADVMKSLQNDAALRNLSSEKTREKYEEKFSFSKCRQDLLDVILNLNLTA